MKISTLLCLVLLAIVSKAISQPVITSFAPTFAKVGDTITITGKNFSVIPNNNFILFGSVEGDIVSANSNKLAVIVPKGASYGTISISVNNLTGYSSDIFTPKYNSCSSGKLTFTASDSVFNPSLFFEATVVQYYGFGSDATNLASGDLNGDGKPDIVTSHFDTISILKNASKPGIDSFTKSSFITSLDAGNVAIADFDGDGKPDLINYNQSSSFAIFKNNGKDSTITFGKEKDFNLDSIFVQRIEVADLDGDGKPDLIVTGYNNTGVGTGIIWVLKNNSLGNNISFARPVALSLVSPQYALTSSISQTKIGDFDGDGKLDIVVSYTVGFFESNGSGIAIFLNQSTKANILFSAGITVGEGASAINVGDIDGDGKIDIIYGSSYSDTFYTIPYNYFNVLINKSTIGNISFSSIGTINYSYYPIAGWPTSSSTYSIEAADIYGDGNVEVICNSQIFLSSCTLPLTLLNFTAKPNDNHVALQWQTANEVNTAKFTIERSTDGSQFGAIGTVSANGNTTTSTYKFADVLLSAKVPYYYYRLKMIDNTGKYTYSSIVKVAVSTSANNIRIAPNPFVGGLALTINSTENTNATLILTSIDGKVLIGKKYTLRLGNNSLVVNETNKLAEGIYQITILIGNDKKTLKIEKQ